MIGLCTVIARLETGASISFQIFVDQARNQDSLLFSLLLL